MQETKPLARQVDHFVGREGQAGGEEFALVAKVIVAATGKQRVVIEEVDVAIVSGDPLQTGVDFRDRAGL